MPRVGRRSFLGLAGAAAVGAAGTHTASAAGGVARVQRSAGTHGTDPPLDGTVGVIAVCTSRMIVLDSRGGGTIVVSTDSTVISRGPNGPLANFDEFVSGDTVVVSGQRRGSVVFATYVATPFEASATVIDRIDSASGSAHTQAGPIELDQIRSAPEERSFVPAPGDRLDILTWRDPLTNDRSIVLAAAKARTSTE